MTRTPRHDRDVVTSMLRAAAAWGALTTGAVVLVAFLLPSGGGWAALSAGIGAALATAAIVGGSVAIRWLLASGTAPVIPGALLVLVGVLAVLGIVGVFLDKAGWLDARALGWGTIAALVASQVGMVVAYLRGRHLVYDVALPGSATPERTEVRP